MKAVVLIAFSTALGACASAGPVVSNLSYDARGVLIIEKCKVHTNFFFGTMELTECSTHGIVIVPPAAPAARVAPALRVEPLAPAGPSDPFQQ